VETEKGKKKDVKRGYVVSLAKRGGEIAKEKTTASVGAREALRRGQRRETYSHFRRNMEERR